MNVNIMNINSICNTIRTTFESVVRSPAKTIPVILLVCSFARRPGLSVIVSTAKIIEALSKKGIPTDNLPDGQPNFTNKLVHGIVTEVYRAIKEDMNIQVGLGPASINIMANGSNAGGPVVSTGFNVGWASGGGIAQ